jgi:hypothetical protein
MVTSYYIDALSYYGKVSTGQKSPFLSAHPFEGGAVNMEQYGFAPN